MSDDILEQAAERRMRRSQRNGAKPDGLIIDQFDERSTTDAIHPNAISPRGRRGMKGETTLDDFLLAGDETVYSPPFILCRIHDKELKCLLDTSQNNSQINKTVVERLPHEAAFKHRSSDRLNNVKLTFNTQVVMTSLHISDIGADLVMGNDILVKHKCILNYEERRVQIGGSNGVSIDFIPDRDIPIKFRCKHLGASI